MTTDKLSAYFAGRLPLAALSGRDWEHLLGQSRRAMLTARLALTLKRRGEFEAVPEAPRRHLGAALQVAHSVAQQRRVESLRIARVLQAIGVRCVLLKGAAYLCAGLPPERGRIFGDIDILVPAAELSNVERALLGAGWISHELDPYNQRYYRQMHELPPLMHVLRGTIIDVHHTITPPTSAFNVDGARLLARAVNIEDLAGGGLAMLAPADLVLHSAVHLFQEGEFDHGLRDLLDVDDLVRHCAAADPAFWPALLERAAELRLQVPLYHALFHLERLFGTRVPAAQAQAIHALAPPWLPRTLMAALLTRALRPNHPSCRTRFEPLARWLLYVRSHWLRMPLRLLVPHLVRKAWMGAAAARRDEPATPAAIDGAAERAR